MGEGPGDPHQVPRSATSVGVVDTAGGWMRFDFQCQRCGCACVSFDRRPNRNRRFCSRKCRYPCLLSVESRLLEHRVVDCHGCWLWTGAITSGGYGQLRLVRGGKPIYVHHLSAMQSLGFIPHRGRWVLHRCDVKSCFNPTHLYLGTRKDNTKDAVARGQVARGEQNGGSRLTVGEVREIRRLRGQGKTQQAIADQFGITQSQVSVIESRKQWAFAE